MIEPDKYYPLKEIVTSENKKGLFPFGRTTFLAGVKNGKFPKPVRFSSRLVAWRGQDLLNIGGVHE